MLLCGKVYVWRPVLLYRIISPVFASLLRIPTNRSPEYGEQYTHFGFHTKSVISLNDSDVNKSLENCFMFKFSSM